MADHWEVDRIFIDSEFDNFLVACNKWLIENPEWEPMLVSTLAPKITWLTVRRRVVN